MIYMVECALGPDETDAKWQAWYEHMKPPSVLLSVPGFRSAQRFKGISRHPPAYLAMYSIASAEVMSSPAYQAAGGGNFRTEDWKPLITFWHRALYEGLELAPAIGEDEVLVKLDADAPEEIEGVKLTWLSHCGLDRPSRFRGLAVWPGDRLAELHDRAPGAAAYAPRTRRLTPPGQTLPRMGS